MRRIVSLPFALTLALLAMLAGGAPAQAADKAMQSSLHAFFAAGIEHQGARAELKEVIRWPETRGRIHWRLPHINNHPARISLIAEQGKGHKLRRWYVPVSVHWWSKALVAARDIPARSRIDASMLKLARTDMAGMNGNWWREKKALLGTLTTRPLHAGQPVLSSNITRPALLKYGDQVTLVSNIGGIRVTALGKVLRNAGIGDRIRVQNVRSKEIIQATILDAHTARVESGGAS